MVSLKKKNAANIKDLTRQLQSFQKKATAASSTITPPSSAATPTSLNDNHLKANVSRENSISSLSENSNNFSDSLSINNTNTNNNNNIIYSIGEDDDRFSIDSSSTMGTYQTSGSRYQHEVLCDGFSNGGGGGASLSMSTTKHHSENNPDDVYVFDIDKQKLVEKIVKLQKKLAKSNEKIDFLQDHVNQLTIDLKRKTRWV